MSEKMKIFIAEDEPDVLLSLKKLLLVSGFWADGTQDALQVLSLVERSRPDLILLDLKMPKVDGFTLCANIRQNPITKNIPIIVLSGLCAQEDIDKALTLGANGYFSKPYDFLKLVKLINSTLEGKI